MFVTQNTYDKIMNDDETAGHVICQSCDFHGTGYADFGNKSVDPEIDCPWCKTGKLVFAADALVAGELEIVDDSSECGAPYVEINQIGEFLDGIFAGLKYDDQRELLYSQLHNASRGEPDDIHANAYAKFIELLDTYVEYIN